jgi:hypothetical protein
MTIGRCQDFSNSIISFTVNPSTIGKIMNIYVNIFPIRTKCKHLDRLFEAVLQFSLIHDREYLYCNTIFDMDWVWDSFKNCIVMLAVEYLPRMENIQIQTIFSNVLLPLFFLQARPEG